MLIVKEYVKPDAEIIEFQLLEDIADVNLGPDFSMEAGDEDW
jgi:hypothetical protein